MKLAPLAAIAIASSAFAVAAFLRATTNTWLATGVAAVIAVVAVAWCGRDALGDRHRADRRGWLVGILGGVAMAAATWLCFTVVVAIFPGMGAKVADLYRELDDFPGPLLAFPLVAFIVAVEEVVFRGLLQEWLGRRHSPLVAIVGSATLYAGVHCAGGSWLLVAVAFGCGLVWAVERHVTRGLVAPLVTHLIWDALIFVVWPLKG